MGKKSGFIAYGVDIRMDNYPQFFGDSVHKKPYASDIGVSEHCRLCRGGAALESRQLAEQYREALMPIFNKRYGKDNFELFISELVIHDPKDSRVNRSSEIVRWRLRNSDFNPKSKLGL